MATTAPSGLDPTITKREITFTVDVDGVTPFLKIATAGLNGQAWHTFVSDEGPTSAASARPLRPSPTSAPPSHAD